MICSTRGFPAWLKAGGDQRFNRPEHGRLDFEMYARKDEQPSQKAKKAVD
jgi:hypothetical protein